jgi:hypothetical protein
MAKGPCPAAWACRAAGPCRCIGRFLGLLFHPLYRCQAKQEPEFWSHRCSKFLLGLDPCWMGCGAGVGYEQGCERRATSAASHFECLCASARAFRSKEMPRLCR